MIFLYIVELLLLIHLRISRIIILFIFYYYSVQYLWLITWWHWLHLDVVSLLCCPTEETSYPSYPLVPPETGPCCKRVAFYVERKHRPSRCEHCNENQQTLRILKKLEKLTFLDGILYRVVTDPLTKHKRFHFDVPESLKSVVQSGIHDHAGHQGQPRTRSQITSWTSCFRTFFVTPFVTTTPMSSR